MKIIGTDNLARENISDVLWLDELPDDEILCKRICDKLNCYLGDHSGTYYKFVLDGCKLYKFEI